jgi:hypothetical protein
MAILKEHRERWRSRLTRAAVIGCVLSIAGCMLVDGFRSAPKRFAFSHALHVEDQGLECLNCHAEAQRADEPGMPTPDACSVCHDDLDAEKAPEKQIASLFDGESFRAMHAGSQSDEIVFSHQRHASALGDCSLCHAEVADNQAVEPSLRLSMDTCTNCHAERRVASECSTCHTEIRAERPPATHAVHWKRLHGRCAREPGEGMADRCELCHREESCIQCHRSEAPENHTVHWLLRGHGTTAMLDRDNCAACHESDSCERCHREAEPQSHVANWGAPRDNHCLGCHFPLGTQGCVACHSGTPSHLLAPPKPDDPFHVRGQNCRQCHGSSAPLPHVDNGDDCNACHH